MSNLRNLFKLVAVATVVAGVVAEVDDGVLDEPEAAPPDIIEGEDEGYDEIAGALVFSFDDDGGGGSAFTMGDDDVGSAAAACDPGVGVAIIDGFTVRYTPSDGTCKTGFTLVNTDVNTDCLHTIPDGATIATEGSGFKIEGDAAFDALLARAFDGQISAGGETLIFGATGKELKVWDLVDQEPLGGTNCADGQFGATQLATAIQAETAIQVAAADALAAAAALGFTSATDHQLALSWYSGDGSSFTMGSDTTAKVLYVKHKDMDSKSYGADEEGLYNTHVEFYNEMVRLGLDVSLGIDGSDGKTDNIEAKSIWDAHRFGFDWTRYQHPDTAFNDAVEWYNANQAYPPLSLDGDTGYNFFGYEAQYIEDRAAADAAAAAVAADADAVALGFTGAAAHQLAASWYSGDGVAFTMGAKDLYVKHKDMDSKSYGADEEDLYDTHVKFYDDLSLLNDEDVARATLGSFEGKAQYAHDKSVFDAHSYGFPWGDGTGNSALDTYNAAVNWYAGTEGYTAPPLNAGYADQYADDITAVADAAMAVSLGFVDTNGGTTAAGKHQVAIDFYTDNTEYVVPTGAGYAAQYAADKAEVDLEAARAQEIIDADAAGFTEGSVHMRASYGKAKKYIVTGVGTLKGAAGVQIKMCPGGGKDPMTGEDESLAYLIDDADCTLESVQSVDVYTNGESALCGVDQDWNRANCGLYTVAELIVKRNEAEDTTGGQLVLLQEAVAAGISESDADKLALEDYADAKDIDAINSALASAASGFSHPDGTSGDIEGLTALLTKINAIDAAIGSNDSEGLKLKIKSLENALSGIDLSGITDNSNAASTNAVAIGTNAATIAAATAARASLETTLKDLDAVIQTDVDQNEADADAAISANDDDIQDITKQGGHIDVDVAKLKSDLLNGATVLTTFKSVEEIIASKTGDFQQTTTDVLTDYAAYKLHVADEIIRVDAAIEALRVSISDQIAQMTTAFTSWTKSTCDGWSADLDLAKSERILKNNYAAMRELYEQGTGSCGDWGR